MSVPYPKQPKDILVRVTNRNVVDDSWNTMSITTEIPLSEKLNEYLEQLGYSSVHTMGIVVRLLTRTKVRVDFKNYTERLELVEEADMLTPAQAISLLEDYLTNTKVHPPLDSNTDKTTQKIEIPFPKLEKP